MLEKSGRYIKNSTGGTTALDLVFYNLAPEGLFFVIGFV
jgi:hypothetical protein